jgi:hypothetical protein
MSESIMIAKVYKIFLLLDLVGYEIESKRLFSGEISCPKVEKQILRGYYLPDVTVFFCQKLAGVSLMFSIHCTNYSSKAVFSSCRNKNRATITAAALKIKIPWSPINFADIVASPAPIGIEDHPINLPAAIVLPINSSGTSLALMVETFTFHIVLPRPPAANINERTNALDVNAGDNTKTNVESRSNSKRFLLPNRETINDTTKLPIVLPIASETKSKPYCFSSRLTGPGLKT